MSDTSPNAFREAAQKLTRLRIDGVDVSPNEVVIDLTEASVTSASRFEIEIDCAVLHHELQQAGVQIQFNELSEFVQKDLREHPQEALSGYLGIVRGILCVESPKRRWRLFAKSEPAVMSKWALVRSERVVPCYEQIVIHGLAKRIVI